MRLQQILDEAIELLQNPQFKSIGALNKSKYQHSKSDDELFIKSDMYKGSIIDPKIKAKASACQKEWFKNPENKKKYLKAIRERNKKHGYTDKKSKSIDDL